MVFENNLGDIPLILNRQHITASGDISASGNIHASNFILPADGTIAPSTNHQTIKFTTKPPGAVENGEMLTIGPDLIEAKGSPSTTTLTSMLKLASPDGGQRVITFNDDSADIDFTIKSDNVTAFKLDAATDMMAFRDHVGIGNSANKWPTDNYGLSGTPTYQLMVAGKTNLTGSVEIEGPLTASGNVSASGTILGNEYKIAGGAFGTYLSLVDTIRLADQSKKTIIDGSTITFFDAPTKINGNVTASGNISASGDEHILGGQLILPQTSTTIATSNLANASLLVGSTSIGIGIDNNEIVQKGNHLNLSTISNHNIVFRTDSTNVLTLDSSQNAAFAGQITASGNISSSGNVIGVKGQFSQIEIDGESALNTADSATKGLVFADSQITKIRIGKEGTVTETVIEGDITASGNISSSGLIFASQFRGTGAGNRILIDQIQEATTGNGIIAATNFTFPSPITASSHISSSGTITANLFNVDGHSVLNSVNNEFQIGGAGSAVGAKFGKHDGTIRKYSFDGNITASGNISASKGHFTSVLINDTEMLKTATIGSDNFLVFGDVTFGHILSAGGSSVTFTTQNSSSFLSFDPSVGATVIIDNTTGNITSSANISASGTIISKHREYVNVQTSGESSGDIITIGTGPGGVNADIVAGRLYCYQSDTHWELADANVSETAIGMLGIAVENEQPKFLLKGVVSGDFLNQGGTSKVLYLSESSGLTTAVPPTTAGSYVRVLGYQIDQANRKIFFDPDKTWVELT